MGHSMVETGILSTLDVLTYAYGQFIRLDILFHYGLSIITARIQIIRYLSLHPDIGSELRPGLFYV
jgi:hypothetical protein